MQFLEVSPELWAIGVRAIVESECEPLTDEQLKLLGPIGNAGPKGVSGTAELTRPDGVMETPSFKNLHEAKEQFGVLQAELITLRETASKFEALQADLDATKAERDLIGTSLKEVTEKLTATEASHVEAIAAKDAELTELKAGVEVLKVKCSDLEKNQKTVKTAARELVAASAGAPAAVDNSEVELTEKDMVRAMAAEQDPKKLGQLYKQYNKQFRSQK